MVWAEDGVEKPVRLVTVKAGAFRTVLMVPPGAVIMG